MHNSAIRRAALLLALSVIWSIGQTAHGALIIIDDFEFPAAPSPANGGYLSPGNAILGQGNPLVSQQAAPVANTIGGQRDVFVQQTDNNVNGGSSIVQGIDTWFTVDRGQYVANTAVEDVLFHQLQYDGDTEAEVAALPLNNAQGLLADLTDGGANNQFLFRFRNSQVPTTDNLGLFFTVTSQGGGSSTYTGLMPDTAATGGVPNVVDLLIPFANFVGTADFRFITSMTFNFNDDGGIVNGIEGADFAVDLIASVPAPEPSGFVLSAIAAVGLALQVRRSARVGRNRRRRA